MWAACIACLAIGVAAGYLAGVLNERERRQRDATVLWPSIRRRR